MTINSLLDFGNFSDFSYSLHKITILSFFVNPTNLYLRDLIGSVEIGGSKPPACAKYGRIHSGICREGSPCCFKCGQTGNFMKECPRRNQGGGSRLIMINLH